MSTPGKPRQSGIPAPGRTSGIPTPGRPRSASSTSHLPSTDHDFAARSFQDAIKANDPAQHRSASLASISSLSPQSAPSGRRSVAARPSSSASATPRHPPPDRVKTPTASRPARSQSRPPSRQSEPVARAPVSSQFQVGDNVRIESLGYEGTLRYVGEIDGKPGLWAGVELSGGFAGKGKNNGSVSGTQYFSCPDKCGVFVATIKLSPPTVGPSSSVSRPASVASSRGRVTPISTGRVTPSHPRAGQTSRASSYASASISASGRVTPASSTGRVTPAVTPTSRVRRTLSKTSTIQTASLQDVSQSSSRASPISLDYYSSSSASPIQSPSSPFATPKPSLNGRIAGFPASPGKPKIATPRPRIPSAVAMPPPASPISSSSRVVSLNDADDMQSLPFVSIDSPLVEELRSRIEALEYDNERLRSIGSPTKDLPDLTSELSVTQVERDSALSKVTTLETELDRLRRMHEEHTASSLALEQEMQSKDLQIDAIKDESERRCAILQLSLDDQTVLLRQIREELSVKQQAEEHRSSLLERKENDIAVLSARVEQLSSQLELEKQEMGIQINELRTAGQETIALYEEQLSLEAAQTQKLEEKVVALEHAIQSSTESAPLTAPSQSTTSAVEIDNETLRDQVRHLQNKVALLEEELENTRETSEADLTALNGRLQRLQVKEEDRQKELVEVHKEAERVLASEKNARRRLEEVEEALRESTVALENAQAEVETLRYELANVDDIGSPNKSTKTKSAAESATAHYPVSEENGSLQNLDKDKQISTLHAMLEERSQELDTLKKKLNRDIGISASVLDNGKAATPKYDSKHDGTGLKEEITGLKLIAQQFQQESLDAQQKTELLGSENSMLQGEINQLRQQVQILEGRLDHSQSPDDLENDPDASISDVVALQKLLKDQKYRLELEKEQSRKRMADMEMKSARDMHQMRKEISELETLVESKIYREHELEQEVERLQEKQLRRSQKKSSKTYTSQRTDVCEICEQPGHDIFNCDVLKEDVPLAAVPLNGQGRRDVFCDECESHGHVASECPNSSDVF
ncbi:hypothetical protein BDN72DRAFT_832116 [Pluteus cervinus]|uniref:Uncharacterized protein n=1 Tax=Pluteus cervinus TaxID=181527 RepID=A0ACD3BB73_9AGAR|nr:hypothetical protein BDN72DRAFT_832116 [Pluteus cervinus]